MGERSVCIILTDSLKSFAEKGEIKKNYYNPDNFFSKVYFITSSNNEADAECLKTVSGEADARIYFAGKITAFNFPVIFFRIYRIVKKIRPSIIRAYDPSARGFFSTVIGKLLNIPVVISLHAELDNQRAYDKRLSLKIRKIFERYSISHADMVICVTDFVRQYAIRYGATNTAVIYNGVNLAQFNTLPKFKLFKNETILCVGRLQNHKYQKCLIRAVVGLKAELALIGSGPEYKRLLRLAEELNIKDKVHFIATVPHNQIQNYYASAKIFAIATFYEGFCIPVIEAMAAGIPVVASDIPSIREITADAGLLANNTPEDFHNKIARLLKDPGLCESLGKKGKERAVVFDMAVNERKQAEVYKNLLGKIKNQYA
ncbi:MAG: glycosyltransferase family 4 protein [Candidatus Omnitrophica bacterium]|nr:glycosyltransferase family 4 protein [Candidatus Omnitrophota bacterium]